MNFFNNALSYYVVELRGTVTLIAIAALIITGIAFVIPSETTKKFAKGHWMYILIGVGIALSANALITEYVDALNFSSPETAVSSISTAFFKF